MKLTETKRRRYSARVVELEESIAELDAEERALSREKSILRDEWRQIRCALRCPYEVGNYVEYDVMMPMGEMPDKRTTLRFRITEVFGINSWPGYDLIGVLQPETEASHSRCVQDYHYETMSEIKRSKS